MCALSTKSDHRLIIAHEKVQLFFEREAIRKVDVLTHTPLHVSYPLFLCPLTRIVCFGFSVRQLIEARAERDALQSSVLSLRADQARVCGWA